MVSEEFKYLSPGLSMSVIPSRNFSYRLGGDGVDMLVVNWKEEVVVEIEELWLDRGAKCRWCR